MRATSSLSQPEGLELRPHRMQFVIDNLPSLVVCCAGGIYGGMEGVPYPVVGVTVFLCLMLVLLSTASAPSSSSANGACLSARWTTWNSTVSWTFRNIRA